MQDIHAELVEKARQLRDELVSRGSVAPESRKTKEGETDTKGFWIGIKHLGQSQWLSLWLDQWLTYKAFWVGIESRAKALDTFIALRKEELTPKAYLASEHAGRHSIKGATLHRMRDFIINGDLIREDFGYSYLGRYIQVDDYNGDEVADFCEFLLGTSTVGALRYREGTRFDVVMTRIERNSEARKAFLSSREPTCEICSRNFGDYYGPIGAGFIHVHHTKPVSLGERQTRPNEEDLLAVCPNCHAMLHRRNPPLEPEELRRMIAGAAKARRAR